MSEPRVLVVDDTPANIRLATHILQKAGFTVASATNASETFDAVSTFRPSVILLDLQLPGIDGFEIARRLKAEATTRAIVILAVTAYAMAGDEQRARVAGCDGYITKPIDTRSLPRLVAESIANRSADE